MKKKIWFIFGRILKVFVRVYSIGFPWQYEHSLDTHNHHKTQVDPNRSVSTSHLSFVRST